MTNSEPSTSPSAKSSSETVRKATMEMIRLARIDPSAFLRYLLMAPGVRDPMPEVHRSLQSHLSAHRHALVELPRDHGKTTQVCLRVLWELGCDPNLRIKIVCASEAIAHDRSRFLRRSIARNPRVRKVFPNLLPSEPWKAEAFTVQRRAGILGPSVAAFGIGAASTGTRADLLICDDVVDVKSLFSKAHRDRVADDFTNNLFNLLEPDGRFWGLSTPWHPEDLNARLKRNPAYAHFRRAVGPDLEPVWPEKWSRENLAERRAEIGEAEFGRGFRLVTITDSDRAIQPNSVQFWIGDYDHDHYERVILSVDPAVSKEARADASALVVLGLQGNEIHVLAAVARRLSTPDLVECIDQFDREWQPDAIAFEANAAFAGIHDLMRQQARFGPRLSGVKQTKSKHSRVQALSIPVQNGRVKLKGEGGAVCPGQQELYDEMTTFPFAAHDDLVDALATGVVYIQTKPEPRWLG